MQLLEGTALIDDQISLGWTLCASYLCWVPYNYVLTAMLYQFPLPSHVHINTQTKQKGYTMHNTYTPGMPRLANNDSILRWPGLTGPYPTLH